MEIHMKDLSPRQREVLDFIKVRLQTHSMPPTVREIGEHFGIKSTNGVRCIITALHKKGYINRTARSSRGLILTELGQEAESVNESNATPLNPLKKDFTLREIPILGRVAAGTPITAIQNIEGTVFVDPQFLMNRADVFALRVKGESMKNAGILDGDLVFAKQQATAETGEMVIAMVDNEATVKYYHHEQDRIRLEPDNEHFDPIYVDDTQDFSIAGKVIGVMRQVQGIQSFKQ